MAIDSEAIETVMSPESLEGVVGITEGLAFVRGVKYEVANGVQTPNLGERKFVGVTDGGVARSLTAQVCTVNQTLMSVSTVAKAGNRVVLDDDGSYIEDKRSGERIWMEHVEGMYSVKMWVSRKRSVGFLKARTVRAAESSEEEPRLMLVRPASDESQKKRAQ